MDAIQGFLAARQQGLQQQTADMQQATGAVGLIGNLQKLQMEKSLRSGLAALGDNATPEQISATVRPYASANELLKLSTDSETHRLTRKATQEATMARLTQHAQEYERNFPLRYAAAIGNPQEQQRLAREREAFHQQIQTEAQTRAGAEAKYNFGYTPGALPAPTVTPQVGSPAPGGALPPGMVLAESVKDPAQIAAAVADFQKTGGANPNYSPPAGAGGQPAPVALPSPPSAAPPAPAPAIPPQGDMRDVMAARGQFGSTPPPIQAQLGQPPAIQSQLGQPVPTSAAVAPAAPVMPQFTGSPKQQDIAKNKWLLDQSKTSIAGAGSFTPQALEFTAKQYLAGDRAAAQGFARSATQRIALQNAIVDEAQKQGLTPEQTAAKMAEFAGTMAGSRTVGTRAANISLAASEAQEMIGIVREQSDKFSRTNFVPWNAALKAYETNTGDPNIAAFGASVNALVNVYARAIAPSGVPTVSDKEHAREVLNMVQSPAQVNAVLGIINRELEIAKKAPQAVRNQLRTGVTGEQNRRETDNKIPQFASEADAAKAGLSDGQEVMINGRKATYRK